MQLTLQYLFFELKSKGYRDGIKRRDKIGMGYESLHIMELLSVQCLQVDDVIPIFKEVYSKPIKSTRAAG